MAKGARYKVEYRRKREGKTDYKKRLNLLKSGKPRLVVRKSNKYLLTQLVEYHPNGDKILSSTNSKELKEKFKWKFSPKNTPAAYLTGWLCGHKIKKMKVKESILDLGLYQSIKGSRVYSVLKGLIDAGVKIPHSPEIFPEERRIRGEHILEYTGKKEIVKNFQESKKLIEENFTRKGRKKK